MTTTECRRCADSLSTLLDGGLSDSGRSHPQHLDRLCPDCLREFQSFTATQKLLDDHSRTLQLPPSMWQGIQVAIDDGAALGRQRPGLGRFPVTWLPLAAAAAGLALTVGFALYPTPEGHPDEETMRSYRTYLRERSQVPVTLLDNPFQDVIEESNPFEEGE